VGRILLAHSVAFSTGGVPLLYLGDEVGQLNDYQYALEDGHEADSRWVHRPRFPAEQYARRNTPGTPERAVHSGLRRMIAVRAGTPELAGTRLIDFATKNPGVLGYQRPGEAGGEAGGQWSGEAGRETGGTRILALANFSDEPQPLPAVTFSGFSATAVDVLTDTTLRLDEGITLAPQQYVWLRVSPTP
jgi:amylosucrase